MESVNLLMVLSNLVLVWITIYSSILAIKWQFEDRQKEESPVKLKEELVRDLLKKHIGNLEEFENRLETVENLVKEAKKDGD